MSKIEDIVIFEDYAGDDLVVATYSDRGVSLVVPFFLSEAQQTLWEHLKQNEHVNFERNCPECLRLASKNGQKNRGNHSSVNQDTTSSREYPSKRSKAH